MGEGAGGAGVGTTLRVAVEADGRHQGEGAIEGSALEYTTSALSDHDSSRFTRLKCNLPQLAKLTMTF